MFWPNQSSAQRARRKVFVSYHHRGDQSHYEEFTRIFDEKYDAIIDNSLERRIDSVSFDYIMRRIREHHLSGSSCTIVLCGRETPRRKYVDWEIHASLSQGMGVVAVLLPSIEYFPNGGTSKPLRLQDNIDSGYAEWTLRSTLIAEPYVLSEVIERANSKRKSLIVNNRPRMICNG